MERLCIGICEDDHTQLRYLQQEIYQYYDKKRIRAVIETFQSAEALLFQYPESLPFQCLLLDIGLKKMDGMELARQIREHDREIPIIFITGDRESVFEGYKVGAVRYLLKPYERKEIEEALSCIEEISRELRPEEYMCLRYQGEYVKLRKSEVLLAEVQGHYLCVRTKDREYIYKGSMKQLSREWKDECFCPANRSAMVNVQNVERITRTECYMTDGTIISVSRGCYHNLNQVFMKYYGLEVL